MKGNKDMNNKISVKEYLDNKKLLKLKGYIPYAEKVNIIDSIVSQIYIVINGTYNLDSVLLDRVKSQIFIEQCTNLNLSIIEEEENLDGYDLLKKTYTYEEIMKYIEAEVNELERILQLRIDDFIRDKASVKGVLNYKTEKILDCVKTEIPSLINRVENIDAESVINTFSLLLDQFIK
jgi:hypothetical protein